MQTTPINAHFIHTRDLKFACMGETLMHHGARLSEVQKNSGMQVTKLCERMDIAVRTYYLHIQKETLPPNLLAKYGKFLHHDFRKDFPEMDGYISAEIVHMVREETEPYFTGDNEILKEVDKWKERAYLHLEQAHKNLEEANRFKELYYDLLLAKKA